MFRSILIVLAALLITAVAAVGYTYAMHGQSGPVPAMADTAEQAGYIVVYKSERRLDLLHNGQVIRSYRTALGSQPDGPKHQEGDGRTPDGLYRIDWRNAQSIAHLSRISHILMPLISHRPMRWVSNLAATS